METGRQKILIVDDRPENLLALERLLKETGAQLVRAGSGNEALKATLHHEFALAILDVQMPGMDGYELAEWMRGEPKTSGMPIIFLTAVYSDEYHTFRGYEAGAVDFITKPYRPEILLAKVAVFLEMDRQRRELQELFELEKTKNYLEDILFSMLDSVVVVSDQGMIRTVNDALLHLSGYGREEIVETPLDDLFDEDVFSSWVRHDVLDPSRGSRAAPASYIREVGLHAKQGQLIPMQLSASSLRLRRNGPHGAVVVGRDIRARVKAREALQRSEERYRALYESSRDGIVFLDMDRNVMDTNQAFLDMVGLDKESLAGLNCSGITPERWREVDDHIFRTQVLRRGYSDEYEKEYIRRDGSPFPAAVRFWLTRGEGGRPSGMWAVARDLTPMKLQEQNRIMTEKMSALGMMAGGIAHELNNPLMGIQVFLEYCLQHTEEADAKRSVLEDAARETRRCIGLVDDLLTFSRTGEPREKTCSDVWIADMLDRVLRLLAYRIEKEGVRVVHDIPADCPKLRCRADAVQQVLLNLAINAVDALDGCGRKEIRFAAEADNDRVRLLIADTGRGIPPEHQSRIFDPFFTTKPVGKGTGLGLSVSRSIVESHGGTLTCRSRRGNGAQFEITLPIRHHPADLPS